MHDTTHFDNNLPVHFVNRLKTLFVNVLSSCRPRVAHQFLVAPSLWALVL
jgi:hypothetical protein